MLRTLSLLAAAATVAVAQNAAPTLTVGDAAPPLKIEKWVKGQPVSEFKDGHVYVVEFWATWCAPCRTSIPHLTKLQKELGDKATIIGVSSSERNGLADVEPFVEEWGDRMAYTVAWDNEGQTSELWMEAANQRGIPTAFVVDKGQRIAWIGHPMDPEFDSTLRELVKGTYDAEAAAKRAAEKAAREARAQAIMQEVNTLWEGGNRAAALDKLDEVIALDAEAYGSLAVNKLELLLAGPETQNVPAAHAYAKRASEQLVKDNAQVLNGLAWMLLSVEDGGDAKLALEIAQRAATVSEHKDPMILDTLARAYYDTGDAAKAISTQEKAIELAEDEDLKSELRATLETYRG